MSAIDYKLLKLVLSKGKHEGRTSSQQISAISMIITNVINSLFAEDYTRLEEDLGDLQAELLVLADMLMLSYSAGTLNTNDFAFDHSEFVGMKASDILRRIILRLGDLGLAIEVGDITAMERALWSIVLTLGKFAEEVNLSLTASKYLIWEILNES